MSMNATPSGERIHIGFFGKTNVGKSSLINAVTGQDMSIVSDVKGTTTDPVKKAMELLPLGPVVMIDTPGLDDDSVLGQSRVEKTYQMLRQTDIVVLVLEAGNREIALEKVLFEQVINEKKDCLVVINKADFLDKEEKESFVLWIREELGAKAERLLFTNGRSQEGILELKNALGKFHQEEDQPLIRDLLESGDFLLLVVPIDSAAPKGRLILPQQQVIRDALDVGAIPIVTRETELADTLKDLGKKPRMVVTDSQVFGAVSKIVPREIPLTSFSILMSRYKGDLKTQIEGAMAIEDLQDGDVVLISEGCTHHRQCGDIGTIKMPKWIRDYTGKDIFFKFTSGTEFPKDLSPYKMVVHCGGCTLNPREMRYRIDSGKKASVPITNYGVMIAYIHGILPRVSEPFSLS